MVKKVSLDIDDMKFNTAIAAMMAFINEVYEVGSLTKDELAIFAKVLSPFAPHIAEEVYESLGNTDFVSIAAWPTYDDAKTQDSTVEIAVQVNGKLKGTVRLPANADKDTALNTAKSDERVAAAIDGKTVVKEIVVPGKIINIVVR